MSIEEERTESGPRSFAEARRDGAGRVVRVSKRLGGNRRNGADGARQSCASRGQSCKTVACCAGLTCQGGTCAQSGVTYVTGPSGPVGPQGPQGPQGPTGRASTVVGPVGVAGPAGPAGPTGPAADFVGGIACTKTLNQTLTATGPTGTAGYNDWGATGPACPAGTRLVYCGFDCGESRVGVRVAYPDFTDGPNGSCYFEGDVFKGSAAGGAVATITLYAVCAGGDSYCGG